MPMTDFKPQAPPASTAVHDAAVEWFVRRQNAGQDSLLEEKFQAWRAADPEHDRAYARVVAVWGAPAFVESLKAHRRPRWSGHDMMRIAASVVLCVILGAGALQLVGISPRLPADYATRVGVQQAARLTDGTRLVLDSDSAVDLVFSPEERRIDIRAGRAFFDVGADKRPFRIVANGVSIRDIGTRFSVERDGDAVRVAVWDGEVAVQPGSERSTEQMLRAGQTGGFAGKFLPVRTVPADISFAWLEHRLFFEQATLGEVVGALRRYHRGWIVIGNARLAAMQVSGGYDTQDVPAAIEDLARLSGATLTRVSDRLLVLR